MRTYLVRLVYGNCWQTALGQYVTKELDGAIWHLNLQPALVWVPPLTRSGHVEAKRGARREQVGYPCKLAVRRNRASLVSLLPPPHERLGKDPGRTWLRRVNGEG